MDVLILACLVLGLVQLYKIRQTLEDIDLPVPDLGRGFLTDLRVVPIPASGVCGRWEHDGEQSDGAEPDGEQL